MFAARASDRSLRVPDLGGGFSTGANSRHFGICRFTMQRAWHRSTRCDHGPFSHDRNLCVNAGISSHVKIAMLITLPTKIAT